MTGRVLELPGREALSVMVDREFCDSARTFAPESLPSNGEMNRASRASAMGLGCVRGTTLALLFEGALGLVAYGVWELCHLVR